jgi:hypothetical protein
MTVTAPSNIFTSEVYSALAMECTMWQLQNECGFLQLTYDPTTGERIHVALNDLHAHLLGMHRDELALRFAEHAEPLPVLPQDLLFLIADDALTGFADGPRHYRSILYDTRLPTLVCVSTQRRHDAAGRLVAVRPRRARQRQGCRQGLGDTWGIWGCELMGCHGNIPRPLRSLGSRLVAHCSTRHQGTMGDDTGWLPWPICSRITLCPTTCYAE